MVNKTHEYYRHWVPSDSDHFIGYFPSEHAWITGACCSFLAFSLSPTPRSFFYFNSYPPFPSASLYVFYPPGLCLLFIFLSSPLSLLHPHLSSAETQANYGNPCSFLGVPFINNCGFDAAGSMLQHIYSSTLEPPAGNATGSLSLFAQV